MSRALFIYRADRLGGIAVLGSLVALWAGVTTAGWVSPVFLPSPSATWTALRTGMEDGALLNATLATIERMLIGWLLASVIGIVVGTAIGVSPALRGWVQPLLEFIRPLPASAVMPVAIALLGLSPGMVLSVIAFGSVWPVMLATVHGLSSVDPRLKEVSRVLGLSRSAFIVKIGWPHTLPDVLTGMRLSLTIALVLAIVGEMLASQEGLGSNILSAARSFRSPEMFAGVVLLGLIGCVSNALLSVAERSLGQRASAR